MVADGQRDVLGRHPGVDRGTHGLGEPGEIGEMALGLEVGIRDACDLERAASERAVANESGEFFAQRAHGPDLAHRGSHR